MTIIGIILIVALIITLIVAIHPRRLSIGNGSDLTAVSIVLLAFTILLAAGAL